MCRSVGLVGRPSSSSPFLDFINLTFLCPDFERGREAEGEEKKFDYRKKGEGTKMPFLFPFFKRATRAVTTNGIKEQGDKKKKKGKLFHVCVFHPLLVLYASEDS